LKSGGSVGAIVDSPQKFDMLKAFVGALRKPVRLFFPVGFFKGRKYEEGTSVDASGLAVIHVKNYIIEPTAKR